MSFASICLLSILAYVPFAQAGGLRRQPLKHQPLPPQMTRTDVETLLMGEFSNAFRDGAAREHISNLEAELKGMYTAVPKDAFGRLGHAAVRYMLHRFFVQKHSWYIRGLEPGNASAIEAVAGGNQTQLKMRQQWENVAEWVPGYLQKFVEEMQSGRGINLRELAVLAATFEDLIHKEAIQRVNMTFIALELPFNTLLNEDQLREALEVYMMIHIWGAHFFGHFSIQGPDSVKETRKRFAEKRDDWGKLQQWVQSIQVDVAPSSTENPLDFTGVSRVADEVGRRYGTYNDAECGDLKSTLLQIESTKAGRVRLTDFYKKGLSGVFSFNERIEYLRVLGAIDDSNKSEPYLIIPNYVVSRPNCLRASDFYVVCCQNECEGLLATIESKFEQPMADPEQIIDIVSAFSTKTVEPRTLSDTLVRRLYSIANSNAGQVPIHGRLFAQWMHHAFPRECPYPHQSGDVSPVSADEWMLATGHQSVQKTDVEIQVIVDSDSCILPVGEDARKHHDLAENELPWDEVEELLHPPTDSAEDVVTLHASILEAPQPSLFIEVAPVFFIFSAAAAVWKMTRNKKDSGWRDGLVYA